MRAMSLEADRQALAQELYTRRTPPQEPQNDPYAQFSDQVLTGDPKQNEKLLRGAVRTDVSRGMQTVRNEVNNAINQQRVEFEATRALDRVMARYPEIADPANQSKFAGLITKAQVDAQAQGLVLPMDQIAERAAREFNTLYGKRTPSNVPHVEGAGNPQPGIGPGGNPEPATKNMLEEAYGMDAGTIEPIQKQAMTDITKNYVKEKNDFLRKKKVGPFLVVSPATELGR